MHRALYRAGGGDRRRPDRTQRDTVLAAVKAWPGERTVRGIGTATAILDGGCARRHSAREGRDEETALRSNKETHKEATDLGLNHLPRRGVHRFQTGHADQLRKRTSDVLPKPDNLNSYRQLLATDLRVGSAENG